MKKIILKSDNVQDITVEEVAGDFVLYQGDDIVVIDKEQIAQLVAAQQSTQENGGWTCEKCKTESNVGYRCSWCESPRPSLYTT